MVIIINVPDTPLVRIVRIYKKFSISTNLPIRQYILRNIALIN